MDNNPPELIEALQKHVQPEMRIDDAIARQIVDHVTSLLQREEPTKEELESIEEEKEDLFDLGELTDQDLEEMIVEKPNHCTIMTEEEFQKAFEAIVSENKTLDSIIDLLQ